MSYDCFENWILCLLCVQAGKCLWGEPVDLGGGDVYTHFNGQCQFFDVSMMCCEFMSLSDKVLDA